MSEYQTVDLNNSTIALEVILYLFNEDETLPRKLERSKKLHL